MFSLNLIIRIMFIIIAISYNPLFDPTNTEKSYGDQGPGSPLNCRLYCKLIKPKINHLSLIE